MIKEYLENHYNIGKLHNSYLINTDSLERALNELNEFVKTKLLNITDIEHSGDYFCVQKVDSKTKIISVDQIRDMQMFLNQTSVITGKKVAVIYGADQMNINAANSCLKILEETPVNTYIFLLTENAAIIIPTIRSRCIKINHNYYPLEDKLIDDKFLLPLLRKTPVSEKVGFISTFASKDRDLWTSFSLTTEKLIIKFCKNSIGLSSDLSDKEIELLSQFKSKSTYYLQKKYQNLREIIDNTNNFDLDLRGSCVLLIDIFRS